MLSMIHRYDETDETEEN